MGKRVAIATAIAGALALVAAIVAGAVFGGGDAPRAAAPASDAAAVAPDAPPERGDGVTIVEVSGDVQRRSPGGDWVAARAGDELSPRDAIRTGADGAVSLRVGDADVRMDANTELAVPALQEAVRVELSRGRIDAVVPGGGERPFGVGIEGADGVAETEAGEFSVLTSGDGEATVAVRAGTVRVTSGGETVEVPEGQLSRVRRGTAPTPPSEIPPSLFLKVQRGKRVQRSKSLTVRGTTTPGAVISVNGVRVRVDHDGAFREQVELDEGDNAVVVESLDVTGRRERDELEVTVDSRGPPVGGDVTWGAGGNKR